MADEHLDHALEEEFQGKGAIIHALKVKDAHFRGLMERNLMRYFLAIDAAAATPAAAAPDAYARRLNDWFASTERYPRQLHEIDLSTYLSYKRTLDAVGIVPGTPPTGRAP